MMYNRLVFGLLLFSVFGWGQINFEVSVSKKQLGLNERLRVDFAIDKPGDNFRPPSFSSFRVISGPMQSVSNVFVNGKRTYSMTYTYFITPLKKGVFDIEQASIEYEGNVYKTTPVTINVTEAVAIPRDPNDPKYIVDEKLHLVAEVSKRSPYVNEPITIVYKLYFAQNVNPTDVDVVDMPKYNDFWSYNVDIPNRNIDTSIYKGERYNFVEWRKVVLYPQRAGKLEIKPLSLDVTVNVPTGKRDFFQRVIYTQVPKLVSAGNLTINVKPLPTEGQPVDFSGAVGNFSIDVSTSKKQLKANESLQAKVKISGRGNLRLFGMPNLQTPSAIEQYEPETSENIRSNLSGMSGSITQSYTLIPQVQGKYPIPSIEFSFFNPKKKTYETIKSSEQLVDVTEGPLANRAVNPTTPSVAVSIDSPFKFIALDTSFVPINTTTFFRSTLFYLLWGSPLGLVLLYVVYARRKQKQLGDTEGVRMRTANRMARKYLSEAKRNLNNSEEFYVALERALHNYLKAKLKMETSDFSKEKIKNILSQIGVEESLVNDFVSVLENCEFARYTPSSVKAMEQDFANTAKIITQIDKQL
ncbi:MAG: BatD family protein [Bacteroidota bacterium]|nr:BatD family protein [Bacteroidota bacterium]